MSFNFDAVPDRRGTDSLKWRRYQGRDIIPMWVADMDFVSPAPVLEALHARIDHGVFGYAVPPKELTDVVVARMAERYRWQIEPTWIVWLPGLVPALNVACRAYGNDGDDVLTFTPAYPPFLAAPGLSRRQLRTVPLRREGHRWTFDLERFESELSARSSVLLLCHPHNPVGRRYEREELQAIAEICVQHNVVICSDEIHCDLVLDGGPHIPTAALSEEIAAQTVTLMAPSKTFNVPGLGCAFAIIPNIALRKAFKQAREGIVPHTNALGFAACLAAYRDGEPWRAALIDYLRHNSEIVYETINHEIPGLSMDPVQATYLAWIDTTELGLAEPARFFEQAGVGLSDGADFHGPGYVRLNFGCTEKTLREGLARMKRAVEQANR
jgi:cysteine-S-conjugate beta-lyase